MRSKSFRRLVGAVILIALCMGAIYFVHHFEEHRKLPRHADCGDYDVVEGAVGKPGQYVVVTMNGSCNSLL